ncbi:MAG: redox-sensing transcriptional repressor Rex [Bacillota bacterium]
MPETKNIPNKIIQRLPQYYVQLKKLLSDDTDYISSEKLSKIMGFSSSLIRRDLSHFGSFGKKSYGYDINCLFETISKILGFSKNKRMIIIGAGFLGRALANNKSYQERGYELIGLFDKDPAIIGLEFNGLKVMDIEFVPGFIKQHNVKIAALAVPSEEAQKVADLLIDAGIEGLWDFTETPISTPENIILVEQNMNDGLCKLSCRLIQKNNHYNQT